MTENMIPKKPNASIEVHNFLNGQWVKGSGSPLEILSPYYGNTIGNVHFSNANDLNHSLDKAAKAQRKWQERSLKDRCQVMFEFRSILKRDLEKISEIISLENGKTIAESRAGLLKGIEVLEYALSLQNSDLGGKMEVSRGVFCEYRRKPLGLVACITPFNFPAMVPMWTLPISITLGNSCLWKPSEKTPLTSISIANAFKEAGLPDGILNVIQGDREIVEAICDHPMIKAVSFVGSTPVAQSVYKRATQNSKRCLALGGAKNHIILMPDADPEIAGPGISDSFTGCAGQRCMAASVLLAVGSPQKQIDHLVKRAQSQRLGIEMGAIITKEQVQFLNDSIDKAVAEGATLLLDGRKALPEQSELKEGHWIGPTILDNVSPESFAAKKELFGPILSIVRVDNLSEALKIENSNPYGNACSVFTSNGAIADKVAKSASAGMIGINIGVPVPREPFSFGGINDSKFGQGDITGDRSLDFWTDPIKVTSKWHQIENNPQNWMRLIWRPNYFKPIFCNI